MCPKSPLPRCSNPVCRKKVVEKGKSYCDEHQKEEYKSNARIYESDPFYNSVKWRRFSKRFLRLNPFCEACKKKGLVSPSRVSDHVVPRKLKRFNDFDRKNLQALCYSCDGRKRVRERSFYSKNLI